MPETLRPLLLQPPQEVVPVVVVVVSKPPAAAFQVLAAPAVTVAVTLLHSAAFPAPMAEIREEQAHQVPRATPALRVPQGTHQLA
jgi:hypothetical protein